MSFLHRLVWQYGMCKGFVAKRNRFSGEVQRVLWKAGEQGHAKDFWYRFDPFWWDQFSPNLKMKSIALILTLSLSLSTARAQSPLGTSYASAPLIQKQLDAQVRSGAVVNASKVYGGVVTITPGEHTWTQPVFISSAQGLDGGNPQTTLIHYKGPPGTAAITVYSYNTNGYVHRPSVRNLQIDCAPGTYAIAKDAMARWIDRLQIEHVVTNGGLIFGGENYRCIFSDIEIKVNDQQALRIDGQGNVLNNCSITGTITNPKITAAIETHGSVTLSGYNMGEGTFSCPTWSFNDWQGWTGYVDGPVAYTEAHGPSAVPSVAVNNARVTLDHIGVTAKNPGSLSNGAILILQKLPDAGAVVSPDGKGKLIVGGVEQTMGVSR